MGEFIEALRINPAEIDLIADNEQSRDFRDKVNGNLNQGYEIQAQLKGVFGSPI